MCVCACVCVCDCLNKKETLMSDLNKSITLILPTILYINVHDSLLHLSFNCSFPQRWLQLSCKYLGKIRHLLQFIPSRSQMTYTKT